MHLKDSDLIYDIIIGLSRTHVLDSEFAIRQLVEIASRALSPGINDPYTAFNCIDKLLGTLTRVAKSPLQKDYIYDDDRMVLKYDYADFSSMMNEAFNMLRGFAKDTPAVMQSLMKALFTIRRHCADRNSVYIVMHHANMLLNRADGHIEEKDELDLLKSTY